MRPIEPTGSQAGFVIPAPTGITRARVEAFGRAERHSRRVRRLKFLLPLAAVVMLAGFVGYAWLSKPSQISVDAQGSAFSDGKLVMANPKMEGMTKDGRPYLMTAVRAIQDFDEQGIINLEGIEAKMPVENDNWATVVATSGVYDRTANTLGLAGDITVNTTDGMVAKLASAFLDIGKGSLTTSDPVDIARDGSKITADSMSVFNNGKLLVFEKRVRMHIDQAGMKAQKQASGGTDASN